MSYLLLHRRIVVMKEIPFEPLEKKRWREKSITNFGLNVQPTVFFSLALRSFMTNTHTQSERVRETRNILIENKFDIIIIMGRMR